MYGQCALAKTHPQSLGFHLICVHHPSPINITLSAKYCLLLMILILHDKLL